MREAEGMFMLSLLDGGIGNLCTGGSDGWVEEEEETGRLLSNGTKQIVGMSNRHALSCRRRKGGSGDR